MSSTCEDNELWLVEIYGSRVALRSHHGTYLSATPPSGAGATEEKKTATKTNNKVKKVKKKKDTKIELCSLAAKCVQPCKFLLLPPHEVSCCAATILVTCRKHISHLALI